MLNILVSYAYMDTKTIEYIQAHPDIKLMLDSGAYTAFKIGKEILLDDYCKFIESLPFTPYRYFNLDVIGDAEASLKNYEIMISRGLKPVPVYQRDDEPAIIETYYETSDVLAIGGLNGLRNKLGYVKALMEFVGDRKVHWLGFNNHAFVAHYRPYTCDTSTWAAAVRFASVKLYDRNGRWIYVSKKDFQKQPSDKIMELITSYGIDPHLLSKTAHWKNSGKGEYALELLTCRSWTKYQIDVRNKLGTNFFLACASDWQVRLIHDSYHFWKTKGMMINV